MNISKYGIYSSEYNDCVYMVLDNDCPEGFSLLTFTPNEYKSSEIQKEIIHILKNKKVNTRQFQWMRKESFKDISDGYLGQFDVKQIDKKYIEKYIQRVYKKQEFEDRKDSTLDFLGEYGMIVFALITMSIITFMLLF